MLSLAPSSLTCPSSLCLPPCPRLTCKTLRLNRVTSIRASWDPQGQRNPEHFLPWDGEVVKADASPLPNLIIKLLTEDEREYICEPANLVVTCQRDKEKDLDFYTIFKPPVVVRPPSCRSFHPDLHIAATHAFFLALAVASMLD